VLIDYFDASAIAAIILPERSSDAVAALVDTTEADIRVSEFSIAETSSAISRLFRMKQHNRQEAERLFLDVDRWVEDVASLVDIQSSDFARATDLVRDLDLKLRAPDALHLAISERLDARLITLDRNLAAAARAVGATVHNPAELSAT
jgi:uncharacterized protein